MADPSAGTKPTDEQLIYAKLLDIGMKLGLLMLVVSYAVYLSGALPPHVPLDQLPDVWTLNVHDYLAVTNIQPGLAWIGMVGKGDFLNFIGIAFLAGVTILCYLPLIPMFFKKGDAIYGVIAVLEVLVLSLAASGILQVGGH